MRYFAQYALLCVLFTLAADAQQRPFAISVDTQLVIQTVIVKDRSGNPVEGLTSEDFVVTEDSIRQTISVLDFQKLDSTPLPALETRRQVPPPVAPVAIAVGRSGEVKYGDRRLLVLYFDAMTMSQPDQFRAFGAAREFIRSRWPPRCRQSSIPLRSTAIRSRDRASTRTGPARGRTRSL